MSQHIPLEIHLLIIGSLPVRSLIRCRSVSKLWKSFIDSSEFIAAYRGLNCLLVRYEDPVETEEKYVSFVDDDTFPLQKHHPTVPLLVDLLDSTCIVGISHGLVCLCGYYGLVMKMVVLWNPSIRKAVAITVPKEPYSTYETINGFGVCPYTNDPKIVKITHSTCAADITSIPWQVEIFTLSSGVWRTLCTNLSLTSIDFIWSQVVAIDCFIYWLAFDRTSTHNLVMSFDMAIDEFREIALPDSLALLPDLHVTLSIYKLRESVATLDYNEKHVWGVWMMESGATKSFTKLFTIMPPHASITILGFRKSGKPIIEMQTNNLGAVVAYDSNSNRINELEIYGHNHSFFAGLFTETLLLLDQSDRLISSGRD